MTIAILIKIAAPGIILAVALAAVVPPKHAATTSIDDLLDRLETRQRRAPQSASISGTIGFENGVQVARLEPE